VRRRPRRIGCSASLDGQAFVALRVSPLTER
jgi:hypothetical protein